jgi:signal transduction histidine kinase/DNA-binding response OmpR family regulator/HAMP domain-containing protein
MSRDRMSVLTRFSIATRLVVLSVSLLLAMAGSSLYLLWTLEKASATTEEAHRVAVLIDTVGAVRAAFSDLRYWQADLSVSLLTLAETRAAEARQRLAQQLDALASGLPSEAAALRASAGRFDTAAVKAVDAYTDDQRVIGNTLFAEARQNGVEVDRILTELEAGLQTRAQNARTSVLDEFSAAAYVSLLATMGAVLVGGVLTFVVLASILKPLRRLVAAIHDITAGNTDVVLPPASKDELGKVREALVLLHDTTEERAELAIKSEHQRKTLFDAVESINQGFALYDPDDRLLMINSHYRALQPGLADVLKPGTPFAEVLKAAAAHGVGPDQKQEDWITDRLTHRGRKDPRIEQFTGGRWVQINERRTHDGGIVATYTDVTDFRERQAELEEAKEAADRATQVKSEFLANMSHELRTPLNAIIGYSQILQEDAADAGQTEAISDLKKIESAGSHLLHLINDILDLSKIEAGRMEVYVENFDVATLIRDVQTLVEPLAAGNGNTIVIDCPTDIGKIASDFTKVKQAVLNLMSNATKFTKNGTVTLKAERVSEGGERRLSISVADTGIGMTDEQMGRLFQAFSQADNSTTRKFGGTGLGLAISRSFARALGGDLTVASEVGKGSVFTLTLRDEPEDGSETALDVSGAAQLPPPAATVLVVDDDPTASHIIGSHLLREGYTLLYASSGPEALDMAKKHKPDAITLDIMMPHVDGWSVLVSLKSDPELASIPVVIISITDERSVGFTLGAAAMLTKPLDRGALTRALQQVLPATTGGAKGADVLIVEDDPVTRELMERVVEKLDLRFASVTNGREAVDWLNDSGTPSAILLDLNMPEMNGFEFLAHLRRNEDWSSISVIVVTAQELSVQERQILNDRTQGVIAKGQAAHIELSQAIRGVTAAKKAVEPVA